MKRISFDGGAGEFEQGYFTNTNTGKQSGVSMSRTNMASAGKAENEGSVFGFGWKSSSDATFGGGATSGQSAQYSDSQQIAIVMHFADPDVADSFVIDLYEDNFSYRRAGDVVWSPIMNPDDPQAATALYAWTVCPNLADGEYDLRITLGCNYSTSQSGTVPFLIDRTSFEAFGVISPVNYPVAKGQEVSILFNKDLDCPKLQVTMSSSTNSSVTLAFLVVCDGKSVDLMLTPTAHDSLRGASFNGTLVVWSLTGYNIAFTFTQDTVFNECQPPASSASSSMLLCLNGGSCVDTLTYFECQCIMGYTGTYCENGL